MKIVIVRLRIKLIVKIIVKYAIITQITSYLIT